MPLLLADLDNTLIDRAGAFSRWAREFAAAHAGSQADAQWLVAADRDGLESRERLAAMISGRFGLDGRAEAGLLAELRGGLVRQIIPGLCGDRGPARCPRGGVDAVRRH